MITKQQIIDYAINTLNINAIGFTLPIIPTVDINNYREYLKTKNHNDMLWMYTRQVLREDPSLLMENTKSIVVLGFNYFNLKQNNYNYTISNYANQQLDYHIWVKEITNKLAEYINAHGYTSRSFVDSAPILEKVLAKQTNIGWQGKHTCIVSKDFGSWLFLSVILTSAILEPDEPHKDYCGKCTKCIDACPTKALTPYKINVKKCLSYLTIEHRSAFPNDVASQLSTKVFGCDDCIKSCYFNKYKQLNNNVLVTENNNYPTSLENFLLLEKVDFNKVFNNTPLKRTGYYILMRNCLLAMLNNITNIKKTTELLNKLHIISSKQFFMQQKNIKIAKDITKLSKKILKLY